MTWCDGEEFGARVAEKDGGPMLRRLHLCPCLASGGWNGEADETLHSSWQQPAETQKRARPRSWPVRSYSPPVKYASLPSAKVLALFVCDQEAPVGARTATLCGVTATNLPAQDRLLLSSVSLMLLHF